MRRAESQRHITTTPQSAPKNTPQDDTKETPPSWGWFVSGDTTPPSITYPKGQQHTAHDRVNHTQAQTNTAKKQPTNNHNNRSKAPLSIAEHLLFECLSCCQPKLIQSFLSMTGISAKPALLKEITEHDETPPPHTMSHR